jgi:polyhydroxyalkanoate synthesis regulator phasin
MSSMIKKLRSLGEERFAEVMDELLKNENFSNAVARALNRTQKAKAMLDKNVSLAMSLLNQPTREDFDKLRKQVRSLERRLDDMSDKLDPLVKAAKKKPAKDAVEQ